MTRPKTVDEIQVGPVYPPYQLDTFQHCPKHWDLARRWTPKRDTVQTAPLIGNAIAYGLEHFYQGASEAESVKKAEEYVSCTGTLWSQSDRTEGGCRKLAATGVGLGLQTDFGDFDVLAVEKFFGRIRPDLVIRSHSHPQDGTPGELIVIDHKVKMSLDDRYVEKELQTYDTSNQFFHYAWAVGADYGEPVDRVLAHMIILAPNPRVIVHPVKIDQEHLAMWLDGASQDWYAMQAITRAKCLAKPTFSACQTKYGPCEFVSACHVYYGDEALFDAEYERTGRR